VTPWTGLTAYDYENKYDLPKIAVKFKKKYDSLQQNFLKKYESLKKTY
jgi:hypothetical protein